MTHTLRIRGPKRFGGPSGDTTPWRLLAGVRDCLGRTGRSQVRGAPSLQLRRPHPLHDPLSGAATICPTLLPDQSVRFRGRSCWHPRGRRQTGKLSQPLGSAHSKVPWTGSPADRRSTDTAVADRACGGWPRRPSWSHRIGSRSFRPNRRAKTGCRRPGARSRRPNQVVRG